MEAEGGLITAPRNWGTSGLDVEDDDDCSDEDDDDDRNSNILVQFVQNVIQEISRRARKALRSVLLVTPDHENANYEPIVSFIPSIDITLDTMDLSRWSSLDYEPAVRSRRWYFNESQLSMKLPSHPLVARVEEAIEKLEAWKTLNASSSPLKVEAIYDGLGGLRDLYDCIQELLHMPLAIHHGKKWADDALDGTIRL
ncbi:hypothetical protein ACLOJK_010991 [Asimina triloba]